ncbi:MAG: hypothetical protein ABIQ93_11340 [Saprospiraceae bacterium]
MLGVFQSDVLALLDLIVFFPVDMEFFKILFFGFQPDGKSAGGRGRSFLQYYQLGHDFWVFLQKVLMKRNELDVSEGLAWRVNARSENTTSGGKIEPAIRPGGTGAFYHQIFRCTQYPYCRYLPGALGVFTYGMHTFSIDHQSIPYICHFRHPDPLRVEYE